MKITELLNAQPTRDAARRKLDMASLDLFAAQRSKSVGDALLQRQLPAADLVPPPRDAAIAPTISPVLSRNSSTDDDDQSPEKTTARTRRTTTTKGNAKQVNESPTQTQAANALAALARAAVEAVELKEEPNAGKAVATSSKRRPRKPNGGTGGRAPPMTDEEKRAKQRMLVKKSYYRKIDTLNSLRETVTQLETEYNAVVQASQQKTPLPRHSISALVTSSAEGELLQSFQEMAVNIDRLRHENEGLRALAMEQSKARTRVGILVQEEFLDQQKRVTQYGEMMQQIPAKLRTPEENAEVDRALASPQSPGSDHTQSPEEPKRGASPVIHMTPMTENECIEVARDAYAELLKFRKSKDYITSGGHVFGWRDRRRISGDHVQFALEKTFHNITAEQLAANTWSVLSTERGMNHIYSSSLRATYHLVQRVTDHNIVFYRTMERVGQNVLLKSLILASFVQTETGYMVLFRSIDPHKRNVRPASSAASAQPPSFSLDGLVSPPERKELWVDMFSWGVIEPAGPNNEHCTDFFGGFVPATIAANGAFWMMEVLLIAVRCESECVGPLFILQQPEESEHSSDESSPATPPGRELCRSTRDDAQDVVMELS